MDVLRTPDDRFEGLPDWPYKPHYQEIDDLQGGVLRIAYVDEGPRDARTVVLFHGEPTWSYLYRKMIPGLLAAGLRVLAPDLVGMGRSDKPTRQSDHSYENHIRWMQAWTRAVAPPGSVWFGQDWGSLIGLAVVANSPERFAGIVLANGMLADPDNPQRFVEFATKAADPAAARRWQAWMKSQDSIDAGAIISEGWSGERAGSGNLTAGERAAYNAPFPSGEYQAGALVFPFLTMDPTPELRALLSQSWASLERWEKPFVTAFGKADPVAGWADGVFHKYVPGARGQPHQTFPSGRHFIQEQEPEALNAVINGLIARL